MCPGFEPGTHFEPRPGFDSRTRRHMWVEFVVGSLPCFTSGFIVFSLPKRAHVDWNWPISREKYLKIDWFVEVPLDWLIMRVAGS